MLEAKLNVYLALGHKVALHINPLAIAIITPIMQRAHSLDESLRAVFLKSSSGCDRENHSLTVLVSPCAAGAIPLGVIITTTPCDFKLALNLYSVVAEPNNFSNQSCPSIILTDGCQTEQDALGEVWPDSDINSSLFHVERSTWNWLWDEQNDIAVDDRKPIMDSFRIVLQSMDIDDATQIYNEAICGNLWTKYPKWQGYASTWWDRRQLWRRRVNEVDNNVERLCEFVLRLYVNIVIGRCQSFGTVTLVDFICTFMEDYCRSCLLRFAHKPQLLLQDHLLMNCSGDQLDFVCVDDETYSVQSDLHSDAYFSVNCKLAACTCQVATSSDEFCKHLAAVWQRTGVHLPSLPGNHCAARDQMAFLGLGDKEQSEALCAGLLLSTDSFMDDECGDSNMCSNNMSLTIEMVIDSDSEQSEDEPFSGILAKMTELNWRHGSSTSATRKMLKRLGKINTAKQWTKFLLTHGAGVSSSVCTAQVKPKQVSSCSKLLKNVPSVTSNRTE